MLEFVIWCIGIYFIIQIAYFLFFILFALFISIFGNN